jgi:hypothetical protein
MLRQSIGKWKRWQLLLLSCLVFLGLSACSSTPARVATSHPQESPSLPCRQIGPNILLSDTSPQPTLTIAVDTLFTVTVPGSGPTFHATKITISRSGLHQECTAPLRNGGRLSVMRALAPGKTFVGATLTPASNLAMPSWGGYVVVTK